MRPSRRNLCVYQQCASMLDMPTNRGFNTTNELRNAWAHRRCTPGNYAVVHLPAGGPFTSPTIGLLVAPETVPAWTLFATLMRRHGVTFDEWTGGTYNCRIITGGTLWSPHAYAVALDLNPSRNPYGPKLVTDLPRAFVDDVLALRTKTGRRVFRWGGDWDQDPTTGHDNFDAMHFEITCNPPDLASGINPLEEDMPLLPMSFGQGTDNNAPDKRSDIAWLQSRLNLAGASPRLVTDGAYGTATRNALVQVLGLPGSGSSNERGDLVTGSLWGRLDQLVIEAAVSSHSHAGYASAGHGHPLPSHKHPVGTHTHSPEDHEHQVTGTAR